MNPLIILYGIALFAAMLLVHILVWRFRTPALSSFLLVVLLVAVPVLAGACVIADIGGLRGAAGLSALEALDVLVLHVVLAGGYIASYPAVRAVSPSLDILLMILSSPGRSLTRDEMLRQYEAARLVTARIDDLLSYRLLVRTGDVYSLTAYARAIVSVFVAYRRALGLPRGAG